MRLSKFVLSSVVLLSAVSATQLRADFKDWIDRCSTGAVRTCASLQMWTTVNGAGGTDVVIRVQNQQGWGLLGDGTGGSLLSRIGIVAPKIVGVSGALSVSGVGANVVGNAGSLWNLRAPGSLGGLIELSSGIAGGTQSGGIIGCNATSRGIPGTHFQTCGGGWVEFKFSTSNAWSANDAEVAWLVQDFAVNGGGVECTSSAQYTGTGRGYCPQMVTPEPVTMILLGSGLAGMGGFGLVRRRKKEDHDVTNG